MTVPTTGDPPVPAGTVIVTESNPDDDDVVNVYVYSTPGAPGAAVNTAHPGLTRVPEKLTAGVVPESTSVPASTVAMSDV